MAEQHGGTPICKWLATSPTAQFGYVAALSLNIFVDYVLFYAVFWDGEKLKNEDAWFALVVIMTTFCIVIPGCVMFTSRVCIPCSDPSTTEEAQPCCPCNCYSHLDTPWYVFIGLLLFDIFFMLFVAVVFPLLKLANAVLYIAVLVCAIVKLCIMLDCCCSDCKPRPWAPGSTGTVVVVGQPVSNSIAPEAVKGVAT